MDVPPKKRRAWKHMYILKETSDRIKIAGVAIIMSICLFLPEANGQADTLRMPEFSWDHVPLYMHMRKSEAFTQAELEYLAGFPLITLEKTTGSSTYGSSELGSRQAAMGIKNINPKARVLYYRNAMVNYSTYLVNAGLDTIPDPFLADGDGNTLLHQGVREVYDLSNPVLRRWWVDHCVDMAGYEEIDGIFIDGNVKALSSAYLLAEIGAEKKAAVTEGYNLMMQDLNDRMDTSRLKLANLIRASIPESGMDNIHFFHGSYIENFEGDRDYMTTGINAVQTAARDGKIIAFCMHMGDNLPTFQTDENGHVILTEYFQERMDYTLAMFLICAEPYSYFLLHDGYNVNPGASKLWMKRFAEYDKPLGPPLGPAVKSGYTYTREFEHASVWLDLSQGKGSISWDSDPPDPPPVIHPDFTLKFVVREAYAPSYIQDALITLDTLSGHTSISGELYLDLDSGTYNYAISKQGYFSIDSTVTIFSDTVINLEMIPSHADVKFRIKDGDQPAVSAEVILHDDTLQTNTLGLATFYDLPVNTEYSYTVSKSGYEIFTDDFLLTRDTTINVSLTVLDNFRGKHENSIRIYPVPVRNNLVVESDKEMAEVRLLDINGRSLISERVYGHTCRMEIPDGISGVYLARIQFRDGSTTVRMIACW